MRNSVLLQMVATEIAVATDLTIDTTVETTTTLLYKRVGSKRAGSKLFCVYRPLSLVRTQETIKLASKCPLYIRTIVNLALKRSI